MTADSYSAPWEDRTNRCDRTIVYWALKSHGPMSCTQITEVLADDSMTRAKVNKAIKKLEVWDAVEAVGEAPLLSCSGNRTEKVWAVKA